MRNEMLEKLSVAFLIRLSIHGKDLQKQIKLYPSTLGRGVKTPPYLAL